MPLFCLTYFMVTQRLNVGEPVTPPLRYGIPYFLLKNNTVKSMFFDWLSCYQDHDFQLPIISDDGFASFDFIDGTFGQIRQARVKHEGSYSTSITVHVQNNRVTVDGNPSRYGRLDNLFGFTSIDDCFAVYNHILDFLGLPPFTKCTFLGYQEHVKKSGAVTLKPRANGAIMTRLDLTTNMAVGGGTCVDAYLKALSMMPYRRMRGHLYADGKACDWKSILGNVCAIYPSVYDKGHEFALHLLPKIRRSFGEQSPEHIYISNLIDYCRAMGVTRHEQKIRSEFLTANNLQFYGLSDLNQLTDIHNQFLNIDKKLKVSAMDLRTISATLIEQGVCANTKAANITSLYAINWLNGERFDGAKAQVKVHRARLRKIGIDILKPCNILLFSPVIVKEVIEINRLELQPPFFYRHAKLPEPPTPPTLPTHLRLVA